MKASERKYTGPTQYFHNYEHDPEGLTHCRGPVGNPYRIIHYGGGHLINTEFAMGHGKRVIPQWFRFAKRKAIGWDLASGVEVDPKDIPEGRRAKVSFKINDEPLLKSDIDHAVIRDKLKNLPPIKV